MSCVSMPCAAYICANWKYSFLQMSMPKPVCPNMATATPLGLPGPQTAEKQHAGLLKLDAQPRLG